MLGLLAGRAHAVFGALLVAPAGGGGARASVVFRPLAPQEVEAYVAAGEWRGRAGAFAIQAEGASLVERIKGTTSTSRPPRAPPRPAPRRPLPRPPGQRLDRPCPGSDPDVAGQDLSTIIHGLFEAPSPRQASNRMDRIRSGTRQARDCSRPATARSCSTAASRGCFAAAPWRGCVKVARELQKMPIALDEKRVEASLEEMAVVGVTIVESLCESAVEPLRPD